MECQASVVLLDMQQKLKRPSFGDPLKVKTLNFKNQHHKECVIDIILMTVTGTKYQHKERKLPIHFFSKQCYQVNNVKP